MTDNVAEFIEWWTRMSPEERRKRIAASRDRKAYWRARRAHVLFGLLESDSLFASLEFSNVRLELPPIKTKETPMITAALPFNPRFGKPTISMRKDDETAFVNVRTYWSLDLNVDDGCNYELRVRHQYPEDVFTFVSHDAARRDPLDLVTQEEFKERVLQLRAHEDMTHEDAEAAIAERVSIMTRGEVEILAHLRAYWTAFALLFTPAINL